MEKISEFWHIIFPLLIGCGSFSVLLLIRKFIMRSFEKWAAQTETKFDDIVMDSIKTPTIFWALALGLYLGLEFSDIPSKYNLILIKGVYVIFMFSLTVVASNMISNIFSVYLKDLNPNIPTTGLFNVLIKATIYSLGFVLILSFLGISIAPLITALGVGGLAVALALQDTLANLFAGIHIMIERTVRVGDVIKLENGNEGVIHDISWRTTRIKTSSNNMIVIPNNKLSQSVVTNYHLPDQLLSVPVVISASVTTDPELMDSIMIETIKQSSDLKALQLDPLPVIRFSPGYENGILTMTAWINVSDFGSQHFIVHELKKRIYKAFASKNIEPPIPIRIVQDKRR